MHVLKCKICGGDMDLIDDRSVGMCQHCGNTMTFPKIDDEQRAAAFNRGNHFRRIGEFDKALAVYERIVREDESDAEAHWCCALCRFGIEYVEDPASFEWLPTCHRASFDSFLEDVDYLAAVEHSEGLTRRQYQKDAAKIAEVQRGILATSQNAEPYDVFICYKESDENGRRTVDSTLAQDIYYQLTEQGRKVFFARITLEDVAGAQYEPYIFAALNSAKVMIVVGTKPEYLNAVWVRNEWSRFLAMMKKDHHKLLLPCYRDMDPYDLPEQLSVLQSYDMSKIGFIQDLIRGVAKVLDAEKKPTVKETVVVNHAAPATNIAPLLKRAYMFLEDGEFDRADEFCEQVLNIDPECAMAYVGKLMVELKVKQQDDLKNQANPFDQNGNYQKAVRFADAELKDRLAGYIDQITTRKLEAHYQRTISTMNAAHTESDFKSAAAQFEQIKHYKDSTERMQKCLDDAEQARLEAAYQEAFMKMKSAQSRDAFLTAASMFQKIKGHRNSAELVEQCISKANDARKDALLESARRDMDGVDTKRLQDAIDSLRPISDWKNAAELIERCQNRIEKIKEDEAAALLAEEQKKKRVKIWVIFGLIVVGIIAILIGLIVPAERYHNALDQMQQGNYETAIRLFEKLGGYLDSKEKLKECYYCYAELQVDTASAAIAFGKAGDYQNARERSFRLWDQIAERRQVDVGCYYVVSVVDGKVSCSHPPIGDYGQQLDSWDNIIAVAGGDWVTAGLRLDGTVVAAGSDVDDVKDWENIVSIVAGNTAIAGLRSDGTVVCTSYGISNETDHWENIVSIDMENDYIIGRKVDGTVVCSDSSMNVSDWTDIVQVAAGKDHCVGLRADGTVVAAGSSVRNEDQWLRVEDWKDIQSISAAYAITYGVKSDGTVVSTGNATATWGQDYGLDYVENWTNVDVIYSSYLCAVCVHRDGTTSQLVFINR